MIVLKTRNCHFWKVSSVGSQTMVSVPLKDKATDEKPDTATVTLPSSPFIVCVSDLDQVRLA
jgi:hypothetical protein